MLTTLVLTAATQGAGSLMAGLGTPFVYERKGRRDPFLFLGSVEAPGPEGTSSKKIDEPIGDRPIADIKPAELLEEIESALAKREYGRAKELVRRGRALFGDGGSPGVMLRLDGLGRSLDLLSARAVAEKEFEDLGIAVDAILWNPEDPVAVIDGRACREGDVLDGCLHVYRIGKGGVVFLYKAYRVHKRLNWSFGTKP